MAERPIILDPATAQAVLGGRRTRLRVLATPAMRACRPGDRLWVRETFVAGRTEVDGRESFAAVARAQFAVFLDGWRRYRDGSGRAGPVPTSARLQWKAAIQMPRWASRATLRVTEARVQRLQALRPAEAVAECGLGRVGPLCWRLRGPVKGIWRSPRHAFAAMWNATHGTVGERWEDDPEVVVLGFEVERA